MPKNYKANGQKWPLLLFLHGLGECSNDDLDRVKIHGPAKIVDSRPDFPFVRRLAAVPAAAATTRSGNRVRRCSAAQRAGSRRN